MERRKLTINEAISLIPKETNYVHTYRNAGFTLIGCDWTKDNIVKLINEHTNDLEVGGEMCRRMNHGLVLSDEKGKLFIETEKDELDKLDPII